MVHSVINNIQLQQESGVQSLFRNGTSEESVWASISLSMAIIRNKNIWYKIT